MALQPPPFLKFVAGVVTVAGLGVAVVAQIPSAQFAGWALIWVSVGAFLVYVTWAGAWQISLQTQQADVVGKLKILRCWLRIGVTQDPTQVVVLPAIGMQNTSSMSIEWDVTNALVMDDGLTWQQVVIGMTPAGIIEAGDFMALDTRGDRTVTRFGPQVAAVIASLEYGVPGKPRTVRWDFHVVIECFQRVGTEQYDCTHRTIVDKTSRLP